MINIAVAGITGRMGKQIADSVIANSQTALTVGSVRSSNSSVGLPLNRLFADTSCANKITDDLLKNVADFDVLIDFTTPETSLVHTKFCADYQKKLVIGTTGFTAEQQQMLQQYAQQTAILLAPNTSFGVNFCNTVLEMMGKMLQFQSQAQAVDVEIVETHHRYKKDAPSGTAMAMGKAIAKGLDVDLEEKALYCRQGIMPERQPGTIGFQSIRVGDVIGEHTVILGMDGERIELTHKATDRSLFANGAVKAAIWLASKANGYYTMQDVIKNQ